MNEKLRQLEARLMERGTEDTPSTERVDLLLELAEEHFSGDDPQRLIELTDEALELSRHLDYSKGQAYGLWYQSLGCCFTADHEKGLRRVDESRSQLENLVTLCGSCHRLWHELNGGNVIDFLEETLDTRKLS